jgi:ribonuclease III
MINQERLRELEEFQNRIGYRFQEPLLLHRALTHKSYIDEEGERVRNNEQMEFLGDAVIDLIIRDYSLKRFPDRSEGELSKMRSAVASETTLSHIARRMEVGKYILMGKGEESSGGRKKRSLLTNAFEAVAAAVYLDGGFERSYHVILSFLRQDIERLSLAAHHDDYKSALQEYTQSRLGSVPHYRVVSEEGPDHKKTFLVELTIGGRSLGSGRGRSKKVAEQKAAREALDRLLDEDKNDGESG